MARTSAANAGVALWPPDDTEESVVGVDRHQLDILNLRFGLNEEAQRLAGGGPVPWQAITQIALLGCMHPDGSAYRILPDVCLYPRPMDNARGSYALAEDGPPALVVEVASDSTHAWDLDLGRGKAWSYRHAGVAEYLVLDPTGALVAGLGRGWRLAGDAYRPWAPEPGQPPGAPRWRSARFPFAIGVEDGLAAVFVPGGARQLREGEIGPALAERAATGRAEGEMVGRAEGREEGKRASLLLVLRARFGALPAALEARIAALDEAALDLLMARAVVAARTEDL